MKAGYGVKFKAKVRCRYVHPDIAEAISWLSQFAVSCRTDIVITSWNDGRHMKNSLHYRDRAIDIRIWNLYKRERLAIVDHFNGDRRYDCVLEKDHIHLEVDPK